jgi:hypothetical protein
MASTASRTLSLEDFKPGERVWWDGNQSRFFATVIRTDEAAGELVLEFDYCQGAESVITESGDNTDPDHSRITDWHKIPDVNKIQEGSLLSTNSGFFTWDETGQTRYVFKVTKVEQDKVFLEKWGQPAYKTTLRGNDFSRTLEDALYEWEVESYEPLEALSGEQADEIIIDLQNRVPDRSDPDRRAKWWEKIEEVKRQAYFQHRLYLESTYAAGIPERSFEKLYQAACGFDTYSLCEGGYGPYTALEYHYKIVADLAIDVLKDAAARNPRHA